jgi:hypothetical protein
MKVVLWNRCVVIVNSTASSSNGSSASFGSIAARCSQGGRYLRRTWRGRRRRRHCIGALLPCSARYLSCVIAVPFYIRLSKLSGSLLAALAMSIFRCNLNALSVVNAVFRCECAVARMLVSNSLSRAGQTCHLKLQQMLNIKHRFRFMT